MAELPDVPKMVVKNSFDPFQPVDNSAQSVIHRVALGSENRPTASAGKLVVGILQHEQELAGENFFWFIAKPTHPIEKLRLAYKNLTEIDGNVTLKLEDRIYPCSTPLSQLVALGDSIIAFTAHVTYMDSSGPVPHPSLRIPLQAVNNQMHNRPTIKVESKIESLNEQPKIYTTPAYPGFDHQVSAKLESGEEDSSVPDGTLCEAADRISLSASIQKIIDEGSPECL